MESIKFYSNRINDDVIGIMTFKNVRYITEDYTWIINRDICWHMNDDGLERIKDLFEDPRFEYWFKQGEL